MTFKLDFLLSAHITGLEIEAASEEEALEKLRLMSVQDMLNDGYSVDHDVSEVECTIEDFSAVILVTDIIWDTEALSFYNKRQKSLPQSKQLTLNYLSEDDDLEDMIKGELRWLCDCQPKSFNYTIKRKF